jgi:hypothetical protein
MANPLVASGNFSFTGISEGLVQYKYKLFSRKKISASLIFLLPASLLFTGCRAGFEAASSRAGSASSSSENPPPPPPPVPTPSPPPTPALPPAQGGGLPTGAWEKLTIAPYMAVFPVFGNPQATDAKAAISLNFVPFKEYSMLIVDDYGRLYYHGGGHSGYPGNDVISSDLNSITNSTMTWTQHNRPHVPESSDPLYGSGGTDSVWYDGYPGSPTGQKIGEPFTIHGYARQSWTPLTGYSFVTSGLSGWNSDGTPTRSWGFNGFNYTTGRFWMAQNLSGGPSVGSLSEWDAGRGELLSFNVPDSEDQTNVSVFKNGVWSSVTTLWGKAIVAGYGSGMSAVHYLENGKHLTLRMPQGTYPPPAVFIYDIKSNNVEQVALPPDVAVRIATNGALYAAINRKSRRIYWAEPINGRTALYYSTFDDPGKWFMFSELAGAPPLSQEGPLNRKFIFYWNGYVYVSGNYGPSDPDGVASMAFWRVKELP